MKEYYIKISYYYILMSEINKGIVYLIQPAELVGTNRYKVGCSSKNDLSRCKSYKKGSRYIAIFECNEPFKLEKDIIEVFNKKFKLIAGNEFFEGNEDLIKITFLNIIINNVNNNINNDVNVNDNDNNNDNNNDINIIETYLYNNVNKIINNYCSISSSKLYKIICRKYNSTSITLRKFGMIMKDIGINKIKSNGIMVYNFDNKKLLLEKLKKYNNNYYYYYKLNELE